MDPSVVKNFIKTHGLETTPEARYIDLVSEMGELGKEMLKATNYGKAPWQATPDTAMELGDCLFSLLALASALDVDANTALTAAIDKYQTRFVQKGHIGS